MLKNRDEESGGGGSDASLKSLNRAEKKLEAFSDEEILENGNDRNDLLSPAGVCFNIMNDLLPNGVLPLSAGLVSSGVSPATGVFLVIMR